MPNTIAQNLQRLVTAKDAISSAIIAQGGTVNSGDGLEEFPADIATIPVAPPAPISPTRSGATIYDYDGSVIATYTPEEFAALTEYPTHPTHEYLTADGYNWSLANAQAYSAKYGYVEVGAQYRVTDGKTRLFIHLEEGRLEPQLGLGINGSVDVDWGDGSAHDTMTGSAVGTTVYQAHKYAQAGDYIIALTATGSMQFNGTSGYGYVLTKSGGNAQTNKVYLNALQSLYIGDSVTSIGNSAFYSCNSLASVNIPDSVTSIGSGAFNSCYGLGSISIPDSVTSISGGAFNSCYGLGSISIPDSVTSIGGGAFNSCYGLGSISIPDSVTSIGGGAFNSCYGLGSISIPDSVTSIGDSAFYNCNSLASVSIPDSVTRISSSAFYNCYGLGSISIPDSVTSIGDNAFYSCYCLASISIPDSVTRISGGAFNSCYGLASISIPDSVTSIGSGAFNSCYGLGSISIPDSVTSIGDSAFYNCNSLASVSIPDSVTRISSSAFGSCYGLGFIKFESETPPTVTNVNAWSSIPTDCTIYVPQGALAVYASATNYPDPAKYTYVEY